MARHAGVASSSSSSASGYQLSVNSVDISPSSITTDTIIINGQLRCGGLQLDKSYDFKYPGITPLEDIFNTWEEFNSIQDYELQTYSSKSKGIKLLSHVTSDSDSGSIGLYFKDLSCVIKDDPFSDRNLITNDNFCCISIYVEMNSIDIATKNWIHSDLGFIQSSDQRIKTDIKTYNSSVALNQINALRVVSYKKIETPLQEEVGFIAQEVHKILPNAIEKMTMYIPNMHKWISCTYDDKKHTISVDNSSLNLVYKENIQIKDDKGIIYSCTVIDTEYSAILHSSEFVAKPPSIKDKVFLYGKSVNDFMSLNKDDIFTIAVSAIQMLDQKVIDLTKRIEALEHRV